MRALVLLGGGLADTGALAAAARGCDFVVAADGGARHLAALGRTADLLVGDFDSIDGNLLEKMRNEGVPTERHPTDKDRTDSELAIGRAREEGADEILVAGALGTRPDHGLANQLLVARIAADGVKVRLFDGRTLQVPLCGGTEADGLCGAEIRSYYGGTTPGLAISLVPLSATVEGVDARGLRYPLESAALEFGSTLGVSNRPAGPLEDVLLHVGKGTLLVLVTPAD